MYELKSFCCWSNELCSDPVTKKRMLRDSLSQVKKVLLNMGVGFYEFNPFAYFNWYSQHEGSLLKKGDDHTSSKFNLKYCISTQRIHVWYIDLHLVDIYGKCR